MALIIDIHIHYSSEELVRDKLGRRDVQDHIANRNGVFVPVQF